MREIATYAITESKKAPPNTAAKTIQTVLLVSLLLMAMLLLSLLSSLLESDGRAVFLYCSIQKLEARARRSHARTHVMTNLLKVEAQYTPNSLYSIFLDQNDGTRTQKKTQMMDGSLAWGGAELFLTAVLHGTIAHRPEQRNMVFYAVHEHDEDGVLKLVHVALRISLPDDVDRDVTYLFAGHCARAAKRRWGFAANRVKIVAYAPYLLPEPVPTLEVVPVPSQKSVVLFLHGAPGQRYPPWMAIYDQISRQQQFLFADNSSDDAGVEILQTLKKRKLK